MIWTVTNVRMRDYHADVEVECPLGDGSKGRTIEVRIPLNAIRVLVEDPRVAQILGAGWRATTTSAEQWLAKERS